MSKEPFIKLWVFMLNLNTIRKLYKSLITCTDKMEIKVQENTKKRMVFELVGANHTFCNALKKELWNDNSIRAAAYKVDHPLIGIPKFIVETNGQKDAKSVVKSAVSRLKKINKEFVDGFKKAR